jgi:hypothetical protein
MLEMVGGMCRQNRRKMVGVIKEKLEWVGGWCCMDDDLEVVGGIVYVVVMRKFECYAWGLCLLRC